MLRIEHQVILRCSIEVRVLAGNLSIQPLTQLITVLRVFVMLHGVRRAANAVGPPVVQVPPIYRGVLQLGTDGCIQFLEGNHFHLDVRTIAPVVRLYGMQNFQRRGRVVAEYARYCGDHKIIPVALFFAQAQIVVQVSMESRYRVLLFDLLPQVILHHKVDRPVGLQPQHIAQIIMLPVPYQQALPGSVFPPEGILVLVQRIHAVVAMNVHKEEFHALGQHGVPVAHGNAVDIRHHSGAHGGAVCSQVLLPAVQPLPVYRAIHQIVKVQIIGRQANFSLRRQSEKGCLLLRHCRFPKLLHTEQGFAVPSEAGVGWLLHHGKYSFDVVCLGVYDPLLQVCIADVGMRVVNHIDGFN